jgi:excisionase family DNA binding protein
MKATITPRLLRTREAAEYLAMSPWQLRNLAHDGKVPFVAEEGSSVWRFDRVDLDRYVESVKTSL